MRKRLCICAVKTLSKKNLPILKKRSLKDNTSLITILGAGLVFEFILDIHLLAQIPYIYN